jgi:hypothetical protein
MYKKINEFLKDGGKCLIVEDGKIAGVFLTFEEYEKLKENGKNQKEKEIETAKLPFPESLPVIDNPIGEAMVKDMDYSEASASIADMNFTDDVTLEDLGIDESSY